MGCKSFRGLHVPQSSIAQMYMRQWHALAFANIGFKMIEKPELLSTQIMLYDVARCSPTWLLFEPQLGIQIAQIDPNSQTAQMFWDILWFWHQVLEIVGMSWTFGRSFQGAMTVAGLVTHDSMKQTSPMIAPLVPARRRDPLELTFKNGWRCWWEYIGVYITRQHLNLK